MVYAKYAFAETGKKVDVLKKSLVEAPEAIPKPEISLAEADGDTLIIHIRKSLFRRALDSLRRLCSCSKKEFEGIVVEVSERAEDIIKAVEFISQFLKDAQDELELGPKPEIQPIEV